MQYLSVQKVSEISGYSISALSRWARDGRIPAERDKNNCWYIQYPFPESFRPSRTPYTRRKATLDVVVVVPAAPAPDSETTALEPEPAPDATAPGYTMDDVARAMMELVSYAQKQYMATIDIARELISIESCLEQISTRLVEVIGEQRRLADAWENPSAPSNNTGGGSMTASDGALALQELRRRGFLVERVEKDGAVRLSLKPQSRVTELDLAFTRRWKDAILGELREDYASAPRRRVDHLHHARVVPAARLDREAVSPVVGSGDAARRQDTLADGIASMGADDPALPRRDCERLGAWDYLKACVYEMAEGWDALPERTRRSEDFEKITRALDEWVLTYSVGDYWGFSREAFDARGAQFRAVCREVMGDVLTRRPAPGAEPPERMDALTLLEEHAYFDPAPKVGLAAPSGLVSGTGPATESTAGSTAVGTSA